MAWYVARKDQRITFLGEHTLWLTTALIAAGAEVYGSSDGTNFDNSGAGAINYWTTPAICATTNAWIRLRFPPDPHGVTREMRVQKTATLRRYTRYFSPGPTYFTDGATATTAPSCTDTNDQQYVDNGTNDWEPNPPPPGSNGTLAMFSTIIVGDAAEGSSFFAAYRQSGVNTFYRPLFMDVLRFPNADDADPCIYACETTAVAFGTAYSGFPFTPTTVNSNTVNIAGWFKKGTADEAWVAYPLQNYGFETGSGVAAWNNALQRLPDLPQGAYSAWRAYYLRSPLQSGLTGSTGYKGKSRLFRFVSQELGPWKLSERRDLFCLGILTLPWDGTEMAL